VSPKDVHAIYRELVLKLRITSIKPLERRSPARRFQSRNTEDRLLIPVEAIVHAPPGIIGQCRDQSANPRDNGSPCLKSGDE
jgi:hypothetical protein